MALKQKKIKSDILREAARGEECTFNIVGVCSYDPLKSMLCHLPDESNGMGTKSHDICAGVGCYECHQVVDGVIECDEYRFNRYFYNMRAMVRTWVVFFNKGIFSIRGAK